MAELLEESNDRSIRTQQGQEPMYNYLEDVRDEMFGKQFDCTCNLLSGMSLNDQEDAAGEDTSPEVSWKRNEKNKQKMLMTVIGDSDEESEDESVVMKVKKTGRKPKVDILDSDEDKEKQSEDRTKQRKKKIRIAAEAAQAQLDEVRDTELQQHIDTVATGRKSNTDERAAMDARIAKCLAEKAQKSSDDMVDASVESDCSERGGEGGEEEEIVDVRVELPMRKDDFLLIRAMLLQDKEKSLLFVQWLRMYERKNWDHGFERFLTQLRFLFSPPTVVTNDVLSQAVLAKMVSSKDFDIKNWQGQICQYYGIPVTVSYDDVLEAALTKIDFIFARRPEVYRWIRGTE
jgi:hypothetical protein